jgi:hypothetical protein
MCDAAARANCWRHELLRVPQAHEAADLEALSKLVLGAGDAPVAADAAIEDRDSAARTAPRRRVAFDVTGDDVAEPADRGVCVRHAVLRGRLAKAFSP